MQRVNLFLGVICLSLLTLSCKKEESLTKEFPTTVQEENQDNQDLNSEERALSLYKIDGNTLVKIKDYQVSNELKAYQEDQAKHVRMWEFFTQLIPSQNRQYLKEFEIFYGANELLGYVTPIDHNDLGQWRMGLAIEEANSLEVINIEDQFTYVCIHEYGHILSLNSEQVAANILAEDCSNYFVGEGCSFPNAYIQELFEIGWEDIYDEFEAINSSEELEDFYQRNQSRFVTSYAATNPAEDIAEVFSVFVTQDFPPAGTSIADKKVLALYNYPELVQLRKRIRQSPAARQLKPGSWKRKACKHAKKSFSIPSEHQH